MKDPLIRHPQKKGFRIGDHEVEAISFLDEFVFLPASTEGAQDHVDQVRRYMNKLGMSLNLPKYALFLIVSVKDTWVIRNLGLSVGETMAPGARHSSTLQHLGIKYTFSEGL
jgi:hypothetical protein